MSESVRNVLRKAEHLPSERADRVRAVVDKVRELERRGLLKRQEYSAPTTGDFERRFAALQDRGSR